MFVIATAGHVDHGKSTLIRTLTGMEPDRWAEERRRGMTIDLGYAWTTLPSGEDVAFVDVPGHERFMTNMLAGIGAVPAAMIVVAADEGWGRQTSEHLRALVCLDIRHALLVVTRCDMGDGELAVEEARTYLDQTTLGDIESVVVSGLTGEGVPALREALARLGESLPPPPDLPTRLWVDRSFSLRGVGTVVTGTLPHGHIGQGVELINSRTGHTVTARGIESLKRRLDKVDAVARVALNLRGTTVDDVHRGDALVGVGAWLAVKEFDAELVEPFERFPRSLHLHVGSALLAVETRRLGARHIRVKLPRPLPLRHGDRGILREPGGAIVAGVVVRDPLAPSLRRRGAAVARARELDGGGLDTIEGQLRRRKIALHSDLVNAGFAQRTAVLAKLGKSVDGWVVDPAYWHALQIRLVAAVDARSVAEPASPAVNPARLARELDVPDMKLLAALTEASDMCWDRSGIHRRDVRPALPASAESALRRVEQALARDPFAAPEVAAMRADGLDEAVLAVAVQVGRLLRVGPGIYLLPDAMEVSEQRLAALSGPFTVAEARGVLAGSRRCVVPVLEHLDRIGVTRRVDQSRRELRAQRSSSRREEENL